MEYYTSDSCDSDTREQKTLDLTSQFIDTETFASELRSVVDEKDCAENYEIILLNHNRITSLPETINRFCNLKILDVSNNRLTSLPDILKNCPLTSLIAKHNQLTNESLPKCFSSSKNTIKELNLSGNQMNFFPEQVLELKSLKYLYLGGNQIQKIPKEIRKLSSLQILSLGGNQITEVPESVGRLTSLQALVLSDNYIEQLPASIADLNQLRSLLLHKNRLKTLPTQIIRLKCLTELSLRDNPLVVRFVRDMTLQPPSLLELAGRTIKLHDVPVLPGEVPLTLLRYLGAAQCCVNPKCKGVFFDNRVEHIKFVDFCGKYRIPLLQYLCSSKCIIGSWESREENTNPHPHMMRKVLLG
ncbi:leucine-rich repeat-containing protein 58 [Pectinophora gossypiella]|uniref:leucine-rich repeat-containing protein 58 n=1 Tax=Pectinophora gossypiella TaxID=13191 RepID=UPI00214E6807|nr:leucine-rich repeat-containing protein 58 [Pectinophora gossypiella]